MRRIRRNIRKHLQSLRRELAASGLAFALLAGCGGGGAGAGMPSHALPSVGGNGTLSLSLHVPAPTQQVHVRSPKYVSPDTQYIGISYASGTNAAINVDSPNGGYLSVSSCPVTSGSALCTVSASLVPGDYTVAITTWDAPPTVTGGVPTFNATGELSQTILPAVQVVAGSGATLGNIGATLDGIPAKVAVTPLPGQTHVVQAGTSYDVIGTTPVNFLVEPVDAAGNIIIGQGAPTVSLTSASPNGIVVKTSSNPNEDSIRVVAWNSVPFTLTANAIPATGSGLTPPAGVTVSIIPVQELWTSSSPQTGGANIGGIAGFALMPSSAGSGYAPPSSGSGTTLNSTPIDSALCFTGCGAAYYDSTLAINSNASSIFPFGNLWSVTFSVSAPQIVSFGLSNGTEAIDTNSTLPSISPSMPFLNAAYVGIASDAQGNLWAVDSYNNLLYEATASSSYAAVTSTSTLGLVSLAAVTAEDMQIPEQGPLAGDLVLIAEPTSGSTQPEILAIPPPYTAATATSVKTVFSQPNFPPAAFAISPSGNELWVQSNGTTLEVLQIDATTGAATLPALASTTTICTTPPSSPVTFGAQIVASYNGTLWSTPGSLAGGVCEYQYLPASGITATGSFVYYQAGGGTESQQGVAISP